MSGLLISGVPRCFSIRCSFLPSSSCNISLPDGSDGSPSAISCCHILILDKQGLTEFHSHSRSQMREHCPGLRPMGLMLLTLLTLAGSWACCDVPASKKLRHASMKPSASLAMQQEHYGQLRERRCLPVLKIRPYDPDRTIQLGLAPRSPRATWSSRERNHGYVTILAKMLNSEIPQISQLVQEIT